MNAEDWARLEIPLPDDSPETGLMADAALEWVWEHTTLSKEKELPNAVKLFVLKYIDLMASTAGVTSESLGGMSQTMDSANKGLLLRSYAKALLSPWLKLEGRVIPAKRRWSDWR